MKVQDFIKLEKTGTLYRVVDASKRGYMSDPEILITADRNVVKDRFGDCDLIGFAPATKKEILLYIDPGVKEGKRNAAFNKILEGADIREALESDNVKKVNVPAGLKSQLDEFMGLSEAGGIRLWFDPENNDNAIADEPDIFNFFCQCEEVAYALYHGDLDRAKALIKNY